MQHHSAIMISIRDRAAGLLGASSHAAVLLQVLTSASICAFWMIGCSGARRQKQGSRGGGVSVWEGRWPYPPSVQCVAERAQKEAAEAVVRLEEEKRVAEEER